MKTIYGTIGFSNTQEISPGIWEELPIEKKFFMEVKDRSYNNQNNQNSTNQDIQYYMTFSIMANTFLQDNFSKAIYVTYLGKKWKINKASYEWPRITYSVGGIYNEE